MARAALPFRRVAVALFAGSMVGLSMLPIMLLAALGFADTEAELNPALGFIILMVAGGSLAISVISLGVGVTVLRILR